jgi:hypothetical protein
MSSHPARGLTAALALAALLAGGQTAPAQMPVTQEGIEVQTRGPVHEAFAQPVDRNPQAGPVVPRRAPEPVPEEPPALRPEGEDVQWVPGYWAWDADQNQFLWISGVYRNAPPGQTYVPGYWTQDGDAWRWVAGFWTGGRRAELAYQPAPPASLDVGPAVPAPDQDSVYSPGYWAYRPTGYAWRPGYWLGARPGMVWVPPHYVWTPAGYVFIPGYWDYPLEDRGLLFAPVVFTQPLWQDADWCYRPSYVVEPAALLDCLFVGPRCASYYFGDYYGQVGPGAWQPWCTYGPRCCDPLYGYYCYRNRNNPGWLAGLRRGYFDRVAGRAPLPPRSLRQQAGLGRGVPALAAPLAGLNRQSRGLTAVSPAQQVRVGRLASQRLVQTASARRQKEMRGGSTGRALGLTASTATRRTTQVAAASRPTEPPFGHPLPPARTHPEVRQATTTRGQETSSRQAASRANTESRSLPPQRLGQAPPGGSASPRRQVAPTHQQVRAGQARTTRSVEVNRSQSVVVRHGQQQTRSATVTRSQSQSHTRVSRGSVSPRPAAHAHQQPAHRPAAQHGQRSGGQGHHDTHHR